MSLKGVGWSLIITGLILLPTACANVMSSGVRAMVRKDLSFSAKLANPDAYQ